VTVVGLLVQALVNILTVALPDVPVAVGADTPDRTDFLRSYIQKLRAMLGSQHAPESVRPRIRDHEI
jgi:hypothetical protein